MQTVGEIMTRELITVRPEDSVARVAEIMERTKIGGLPVVEGRRLVGIITSSVQLTRNWGMWWAMRSCAGWRRSLVA